MDFCLGMVFPLSFGLQCYFIELISIIQPSLVRVLSVAGEKGSIQCLEFLPGHLNSVYVVSCFRNALSSFCFHVPVWLRERVPFRSLFFDTAAKILCSRILNFLLSGIKI